MNIYITAILLLLSFNAIAQKQELEKDTLFIKYDDSLLTKFQYTEDNNIYYKIKGTGKRDDFVYLLEQKFYRKLKSKKIQCLKKVLIKSNSYIEKDKLSDWKLAEYLSKYLIFLVKENNYIKVQVVYAIE